MAEVTEETKKILKEHNLTKSDVWFMKNAQKWAITHKAMEKIAVREKIVIVDLEVSYVDLTAGACVVKCTAVKDGLKVITFGECTPKNCYCRFNS